MELPVGEVRQRLNEALDTVRRGESVTVTEQGVAIAELKPIAAQKGFDFERSRRVSEQLGPGGHTAEGLWPPEFDDPAYSRKVLGLE